MLACEHFTRSGRTARMSRLIEADRPDCLSGEPAVILWSIVEIGLFEIVRFDSFVLKNQRAKSAR